MRDGPVQQFIDLRRSGVIRQRLMQELQDIAQGGDRVAVVDLSGLRLLAEFLAGPVSRYRQMGVLRPVVAEQLLQAKINGDN